MITELRGLELYIAQPHHTTPSLHVRFIISLAEERVRFLRLQGFIPVGEVCGTSRPTGIRARGTAAVMRRLPSTQR